MNFEWDEAKNRENIRKHGLDFNDAWQVFKGPIVIDLDLKRDYDEDRWVLVGWLGNRTVVMTFTERAPHSIRIISLRKASKYERKKFEQAIGY